MRFPAVNSHMISIVSFMAMALSLLSCTPENVKPDIPDPVPDVSPQILKVWLSEYPGATVEIKQQSAEIYAELPYGSILNTATIEYELPGGCSADPAAGSTVDLKKPFNIYVTSSSGASCKYAFSAGVAPSDVVKIKWLQLQDYLIKAEKIADGYHFSLPYGADLTKLKITLASDYALTSSPDISAGIDLTSPKEVKIYAEDGKTFQTLRLSASCYDKDKGVRGVYLPAPWHTDAFLSYDKLCESMDLLNELNFNCLYVCAWAATKTAWPSETLLNNSTYSSTAELNMYNSYSGGSGDALADMISQAHKRGIKVVLWFEYGFMHAVGKVNLSDPLLAKHPDWIGLNSEGGYCNYNGTDFYLNSYSKEVQQFMIDLAVEAVGRYPDLDGVQGDDRLPASPVNAGYNEQTLSSYMSETGNGRPSSYKDKAWQEWKMNNLNDFALAFHDAVKKANPKCLVMFAPNKYPWAYNNLCQDWPSWVKIGAAEFLTVQCYVTANYERDVTSQIDYMKTVTSKNIFQPAMILKNGANLMSAQMLSDQLCYNRKVGTMGEAQFWFDGLLDENIQKIFKLFYSYPVEFPDL